MPRRYLIQANYGTTSSAHDMMRITGKSGAITRLIEFHATNDADETSEMVPFRISRCSSNGTGTGVNPANIDLADTSCSGSASYNLSGATIKTATLWRESCNILSGFHFVPTPEARILIPTAGVIAIDMVNGTTNALSWSVNAVIEEEG